MLQYSQGFSFFNTKIGQHEIDRGMYYGFLNTTKDRIFIYLFLDKKELEFNSTELGNSV